MQMEQEEESYILIKIFFSFLQIPLTFLSFMYFIHFLNKGILHFLAFFFKIMKYNKYTEKFPNTNIWQLSQHKASTQVTTTSPVSLVPLSAKSSLETVKVYLVAITLTTWPTRLSELWSDSYLPITSQWRNMLCVTIVFRVPGWVVEI